MVTPNDELEITKEGVKAAITQTLAPFQELLRQLLGPAAAELGHAWGASARLWRIKRLARILEEFQMFVTEKGLKVRPVAVKKLFPLLEGATLEDDEDLHQRWVALLINAARTDYEDGIPAYFPDILNQLSSEEAHFLDSVYNELTLKFPDFRGDPAKLVISGKLISTVRQISVDNLERLRLVTRNAVPLVVDEGAALTNTFSPDNHLHMTDLGKAFVKACRLPK